MSETIQPSNFDPPQDSNLPYFVYGALKPGLPAFEILRPFVQAPVHSDQVGGELFVRDGLPLLVRNGHGSVKGFLLNWKSGQETDAYSAVCGFEPRKHYRWEEVDLQSGAQANALIIRSPNKGNPQPLSSSEWTLSGDTAFGPGLEAVQQMVAEIDHMPDSESEWPRFFRSQMAYLLLWSILERLSALCFGAGQDPTQRAGKLHTLQGMSALIAEHVQRSDTVSDSRDPTTVYRLDSSNAKKCFDYYYQVRSNLSHRGKGAQNEFQKVHGSLKELLAITQQYLSKLRSQESAATRA